MERDSQPIVKNWINSLKIAIVSKNITLIGLLNDKFESLDFVEYDDMVEAKALLLEAMNFLEDEKKIIGQNLQNITKNKKFLMSQIGSSRLTKRV
jgi:hypothetical protein